MMWDTRAVVLEVIHRLRGRHGLSTISDSGVEVDTIPTTIECMYESRCVTAADVRRWVAELAGSDCPQDAAAQIDLLRNLEELTCAAAGMQARVSAEFDRNQRAEATAAGVAKERRGRGIAAQVGLARRESPHRGTVHLGLAKALVEELPCTLAAMRTGKLTEWRATLIARETACLSREDRAVVDRALAGDAERIAGMSDKEIIAAAREMAYRSDPQVWINRRAKAESERTVTMRPAPDAMVYLTALLPLVQGVSAYKALRQAATGARSVGDDRSTGQVMADTLVDRLVTVPGNVTAPANVTAPVSVTAPADVNGHRVFAADGASALPSPSRSPSAGAIPTSGDAPPAAVGASIMVNLVVSDHVLFGHSCDSAFLEDYGPVPADLARDVVHRAGSAGLARLRRVYVAPETGVVQTADRRTRLFPKDLAAVIRIRDRTCRTPYCDAPIRHIDHIEAAEVGGPTSFENGQGLCEACNHAKQARRWYSAPVRNRQGISRQGPHTTLTCTPTGHRYRSEAPAAPLPATSSSHSGHRRQADGVRQVDSVVGKAAG